MTVVGVGVLKSLVRLMREPVTVTSSRAAARWPRCGRGRRVLRMRRSRETQRYGYAAGQAVIERDLRMAARTVAAMAERIEIIWAPSHRERTWTCGASTSAFRQGASVSARPNVVTRQRVTECVVERTAAFPRERAMLEQSHGFAAGPALQLLKLQFETSTCCVNLKASCKLRGSPCAGAAHA